MNNKKYLFGAFATGLAICAVLANSFIFPKVSAAPNENPKIKPVETTSLDKTTPKLTTEQDEDVPSVEPKANKSTQNINAISEEQAIEAAIEVVKEFQDIDMNTVTAVDIDINSATAVYVKSSVPNVNPIWVITFAHEKDLEERFLRIAIDAYTEKMVNTFHSGHILVNGSNGEPVIEYHYSE